MSDISGGKVGIQVVPSFSGFGSLLAGGVRSSLSQAEGLGRQLSNVIAGGVKSAAPLIAAAAGVALADFAAKGVRAFADTTAEIRKFQRATGEGAQDSSRWVYAANQMGISVDTLSTGMVRFGRNIVEHRDKLNAWGVSVATNDRGTTSLTGTLLNLAEAYQKNQDPAQRNAMVLELIGKSGASLIPILQRGKEGLQEFFDEAEAHGLVFDDEQLKQGRDFTLSMKNLAEAGKGLEIQLGQGLVPVLTDLANASANAVDKVNKLTKPIGGVAGVIGFLVKGALGPAGPLLDLFGTKSHSAAASQEDLAKGIQQAVAQMDSEKSALQGMISAAEGVRSAQQGIQSAQRGVQQAERGVIDAHEATEKAQRGVADAQGRLNDLLTKGAVDAHAVADAERGVIAANRGVRDATEALADAQERLNELQRGATADELTDAHLSLAGATLALAEARFGAARARPTADDPFAVQRARLGVREAAQRQKEAQEAVTAAQQKGTASDKSLADAQRQVRDATERVNDAMGAQTEAQEKLRGAQAGDPEFQQKVAEARRGVADAQEAVNKAQQGEVDARQAVIDARDQLNEATLRLRDSQYGLDDAFDKGQRSVADMDRVIGQLVQKYPELAPLVGRFSDLANAIGAANSATQSLTGSLGQFLAGNIPPPPPGGTAGITSQFAQQFGLPQRAAGGPIYSGRAFLVGEDGPEILYNGRVYPSGQAPPELRSGNDGAATLDPAAFASAVASAVEGMTVVLEDGTTMGRVVRRSSRRHQRAFAGRR